MSTSASTGATGALETRAIEQIPVTERHGKPWHQLAFWFSSNIQITGLVTGAVAIIIGLSLPWAIFSIVVGNLVGAVFMAYHAVQGPKLGVPQMIQSRAQFGFFGASLPCAIVVVMYLGFATEGGVVAGKALAGWLGLADPVGVVLFNLLPLVVAFVGHDLIHALSRWLALVSGVLFLVLFVVLLGENPVPSDLPVSDSFATVLVMIAIAAGWQITWAPYVSDYSRYLPVDTRTGVTFAYTYIGSAVGAVASMGLGAFAASVNFGALESDAIGFMAGQLPAVSGLIIVLLLLGTLPAAAEGPYGAFLTALSVVSPTGRLRSSVVSRAVFTAAFTLIATVLGILASGHMLHTFQTITLFLLNLLVPWTAINLVDYYIVRRGRYDVAAMFDLDGEYGRFNVPAVLVYLATMAIQVPFISSQLYTGPMVQHLGGADISWIIGLVVGGVAYYAVARRLGVGPARSGAVASLVLAATGD
jgi:NCS1 family nucleobase:cation symporter-1